MNYSMENFIVSADYTNSSKKFFWPLGIIEKNVYLIYSILGIPTHSLIIWLIITGTGSGITSEFFNLNNTVCELIYCLNCLLTVFSFVSASLLPLTQFLVGFGVIGRPLFQCIMCVERYLAVIHPVTFLKYKPLRYRLFCCSVAWLAILGSCLFCMFILFSAKYNEFAWFFSTLLVVFFLVQLSCLVAVLQALKQSGPGERKKEENRMKRRAFHLILITTVSIVVMIVPMIFSGFVSISTLENVQIHRGISLTIFVLAGFVQPSLFLHRTGKLSQLLLRVKNALNAIKQ